MPDVADAPKTTKPLGVPAQTRFAGLLLHPTSLPGSHGIGDLGPAAYEFVDFLAAAGQTLWQMLPLGPVGLGYSPYAAHSAFAGEPLLISLERLQTDGLLTAAELEEGRLPSTGHVDWEGARRVKTLALRLAAERFGRVRGAARRRYETFCATHADWLDDYALFAALSEEHGGAPWQSWRGGVAQRRPEALERARAESREDVEFQRIVQFLFWEQWGQLRAYAQKQGIQLVGDIPIFVALQSADIWARPEIFSLNERGEPTHVAGVPPDAFSKTGQRWGNPLYRWDVLEEEGYGWWIERFRATLRAVDVIRLDHFRGFVGYYEIPGRAKTAVRGRWRPGPGKKLFDAALAALGSLPVIVEDLGIITPDVDELHSQLGYPGMKVLHFAFGGGPTNPYLPHNYTANTVAYTGTHDNDTTLGWYASSPEAVRHHVRQYLGVDGHDIAWDMIRLGWASVADRVVAPVQDILGLDGSARMNFPGKAEGNWSWQLLPGQVTPEHGARLRELTALYGRTAPRRSR